VKDEPQAIVTALPLITSSSLTANCLLMMKAGDATLITIRATFPDS